MKLRLAIDADNADEARAIAAEVWQKMEVTAGADPQITPSAGRAPHWNVITDLDLSALESITADDAMTNLVAAKIMELAKSGEHDATRLCEGVLRMLDDVPTH